MPSLRLSSFGQYATAGDVIDYIEVRQGEAYAIPFTIKDTQPIPQPVDLTAWTFSVEVESYSARCTYNAGGELSAIGTFTDQGSKLSYPNLAVVNVNAAAGTGALTIPPDATSIPANLITADNENTLINVVTITAVYPSSVAGFNSIRKLMVGFIVRIS